MSPGRARIHDRAVGPGARAARSGSSRTPVLLRRAGRSLRERLRPLIIPRRFQAYCVGTPKSGTMSVAAVLATRYRSAHQPDSRALFAAVKDRTAGAEGLHRWATRRDRRLWLEMDSSHLLAAIVDVLAATFPSARFVLTLRDCFSWLESEINEQLGPGSTKPPWNEAYHLRYGGRAPANEDRPLIERGLYPVGAYLEYWNRHNETVLAVVPPERLFVLRTPEIEAALPQLAEFLRIPTDTLDADRAHTHGRRETRIRLWDLIDPEYVTPLAHRHCRRLMERFFPEVRSPADAAALYR